MSTKYTLTTDHPASSYGHPVFVTDKGTFGGIRPETRVAQSARVRQSSWR